MSQVEGNGDVSDARFATQEHIKKPLEHSKGFFDGNLFCIINSPFLGFLLFSFGLGASIRSGGQSFTFLAECRKDMLDETHPVAVRTHLSMG
jgi:hypothetical protein